MCSAAISVGACGCVHKRPSGSFVLMIINFYQYSEKLRPVFIVEKGYSTGSDIICHCVHDHASPHGYRGGGIKW